MLFFKKKPKKKEEEKKKEVKKAPKVKQVKEEKVKKVEEKKKPEKIVPTKEKITKPLKQELGIASSVLVRPIITEKAIANEAQGCYTFEVSPKANKILIKKAIKELYNIDPVKVNIIRVKGKAVRYGRTTGRTKNWKKAIVFLKKGDKIEFIKK
ncbi:50S ribosomal protein L23 [Patescibacteria group bacterium]|nr:50S ribosomal protein L23 [Patescibacteria group bacterium]